MIGLNFSRNDKISTDKFCFNIREMTLDFKKFQHLSSLTSFDAAYSLFLIKVFLDYFSVAAFLINNNLEHFDTILI